MKIKVYTASITICDGPKHVLSFVESTVLASGEKQSKKEFREECIELGKDEADCRGISKPRVIVEIETIDIETITEVNIIYN